jgi:hypothetical protein
MVSDGRIHERQCWPRGDCGGSPSLESKMGQSKQESSGHARSLTHRIVLAPHSDLSHGADDVAGTLASQFRIAGTVTPELSSLADRLELRGRKVLNTPSGP